METANIGQQYDRIAAWWNDRHIASDYGIAQVKRALAFAAEGRRALDVGCGSGGRFIRLLEEADYDILGIDASAEMVELAKANHQDVSFVRDDIMHWDSDTQFDFILAWDCLFHLPLNMQKPVLEKLCKLLSEDGVLIHTFGDGIGAHTDSWHEQTFAYSSIGISQNIEVLHRNGLSMLHLELDQFPEKHVYAISRKA